MSSCDEVESIKSLQNQDILLHGGKIPLELRQLLILYWNEKQKVTHCTNSSKIQ